MLAKFRHLKSEKSLLPDGSHILELSMTGIKTIFSGFLVCAALLFSGQDLRPEQQRNIQIITYLFKKADRTQIANHIQYPLKRQTPVPNIKSKEEMLAHFDEVFDEEILAIIANSGADNWSAMGWRGIMLNDGLLWLDDSAKFIRAVNYSSSAEQRKKSQLIRADKAALHPSLLEYKEPVYLVTTKTYRIRIDEISNGVYRYASWKKEKATSARPDLTINNGTVDMQGSGGNHVFIFKNGRYKYELYRAYLREAGSAEVSLMVYLNGKMILRQDGELFPF